MTNDKDPPDQADDTGPAAAARRSFEGTHPEPISKGRYQGRTSVHRSHRAEDGPNFID